MEIELRRNPSVRKTTFGDLLIDGVWECYTLEDQIREIPGQPVASWKIHGETAIPANRYKLTLDYSQRFGPDTITINHVPGFDAIRMHGGTDISSTEGCVVVGDKEDMAAMTISGAKFDHVLDKLKAKIKAAIDDLEEVWLTISNPA